MACTPAAVFSHLGAALVLAAGCGGGGATDAGVDGNAADALVADAPPDALIIDTLQPPQGATCADPIPLAPGASTTGDTNIFFPALTGGCSLGSAAAKDGKYTVDLGATPRDLVVQVDVDELAEPPYDAVLYAQSACGSAELACADAGWSERLDVLDASGVIVLVVDGTYQHGGNREGVYTLNTAVREIVAENGACDPAGVASRCAVGFRCVASLCVADSPTVACAQAAVLDVSTGSATATATTFAYAANHYDGTCPWDPAAGLPEHIYAVTVAAGADLVASTDNPVTDFDTYIYMRSAACDGAEIGCADDVDTENQNLTSTLTATDLAAGTYYLFVDGSSDSPGTGTYQLDVTVTP